LFTFWVTFWVTIHPFPRPAVTVHPDKLLIADATLARQQERLFDFKRGE
jgi:hypothetical protein